MKAHYHVAPRYTCGSPAMVPQGIACKVAVEERYAYARTLDGIFGDAHVAAAKQRGLRGIAEHRQEVAGAWLVTDLCTGEKFIRPFDKYGEKPNQTQRRYLTLRTKHHNLPLETQLPPPFLNDYVVTDHGSVFLVQPTNDAAKHNLEEHLGDDAQWFGGALAVEHRYIENLVAELRDEGWTVTTPQ
jgi:hypothetical protein